MNQQEIDSAPVVKLGGKDFPIPQLAARQNMVIDPIILKLMPVFSAIQQNKMVGLGSINADYYKDFIEVCYVAITRANPSYKKDDFLNLPVTLREMIQAFPTIAKQTGIFNEGEAVGAKASPPTGTE